MKRILLLPYHGTGHINPFMALASLLQAEYDCILAGHPHFNKYVRLHGFTWHSLESLPFGMNFEYWRNKTDGKSWLYFREVRDRYRDKLYHDRETELLTLVRDIRPHLILIDAMQASDTVVLYHLARELNIGLAIIHTTFSSQFNATRPPLNVYVMPDDQPEIARQMKRTLQRQAVKRWVQRIKFLGLDDVTLIRRRMRRNNIPLSFASSEHSLVNFTPSSVRQMVFTARELDFAPGNKEMYYGFLPSVHRPLPEDNAYLGNIDRLLKTKDHEQLTLIYCSFGTVPADEAEAVTAFLEQLKKASKNNRWMVIVSLRNSTTVNEERWHVFPSVYQPHLLQHTDLFITHGGLNSIREAIDAEVPLLMFPVHRDMDRAGNAARVVYYHLGLLVGPDPDAAAIVRVAETLLSTSHFRENISRMKKLFNSYDRARILDDIASMFIS
jgi:zeaxanthin glucosyltransferase